ncbi:hypothetical protein PV735_31720 [Streptomyces turgidiscabies]|uniref:hypothetical protein n=1 Tax=Streptomyces turgidiscabies TaxID=85558 RepID=UPI0029BD4D05|nr:hypothetical protein [Streptomyces turgidiscabies]MDX3497221.1 hypothetical protein [Streptomyces turgidiscabies]
MTERRPGGWPVDEPVDLVPEDLYLKRAAERGRHEIVLGSIRAHLEEQPTAAAVYAALRHWISDVTSLGEDVARTKKRTA